MSDLTEGLGGAIEGALLGGAVESEQGGAPGMHGEHGDHTCANCGAAVPGNYCAQCGQKRHVHRSLAAIGHDLIHGVLHLDGKFWKTLPLLVFKPGRLTRRYIDGERAKFVSPMAMFLFTVFAMFAMFQVLGITVPSTVPDASPAQLETALEGQAQRIERDLEGVEEELAESDITAEERAELEEEKAGLIALQEKVAQAEDLPIFRSGDETVTTGNVPLATASKDGMNINLTGIEMLDKGILKKWRDNPSLMLYKLQSNAYKFSWLLIPLSIPFVWLVFAWRRRFKAYDHAVFVTYSLSFMSMLFIVASIFSVMPDWISWVGALLMSFVPPVHLYKHLRYTYELSRFSTFWRLMVISLFIWIVIVLFLQALLLLGAF